MAYNVVNTSWTVNCVFNTTCVNVVTDYSSPVLGTGKLQSRIYQAQPGSTAAGKWVYSYRVDLTQVAGTYPPYVDQVAIHNWGRSASTTTTSTRTPPTTSSSSPAGGIGAVGLSSSFLFWGWTYFNSAPRLRPQLPRRRRKQLLLRPGLGLPPVIRNISVHTDTGWVTVTGYAPQLP